MCHPYHHHLFQACFVSICPKMHSVVEGKFLIDCKVVKNTEGYTDGEKKFFIFRKEYSGTPGRSLSWRSACPANTDLSFISAHLKILGTGVCAYSPSSGEMGAGRCSGVHTHERTHTCTKDIQIKTTAEYTIEHGLNFQLISVKPKCKLEKHL